MPLHWTQGMCTANSMVTAACTVCIDILFYGCVEVRNWSQLDWIINVRFGFFDIYLVSHSGWVILLYRNMIITLL